MTLPNACPICRDGSVEPMLSKFKLWADVSGHKCPVTDIAAFTCDRGHIFFVRKSDLAESAETASAAGA